MDPFGIESYIQRRLTDFLSPVEEVNYPLITSGQQQLSSNGGSTANTTRPATRRTRGALARLDLVESPRDIRVTVELPGIKKDDVQVHLEDNVLSIQAERKEQVNKDTDRYHYSERSFGKVYRQLWLPTPVDADNIQSKFENGVLELCLPKKVEDEKRKKIEI